MADRQLDALAAEITALFPRIHRTLFRAEADDPASELPVAQLRLCIMLRDGAQPMSAVSRELGISLSAVTQLVDRLERAGMVERVAEGGDRRVKLLKLTPDGLAIMHARRECRIGQVRRALEPLPENTVSEIVSALRQLESAAAAVASADVDERPPEQQQPFRDA